ARLTEAHARVPEAEARAEEARAQLEEARINYNAAQNLVENGFASQTRVASTRAAVSSAQAAVQSATSGLEAAKAGIESARAAVAAAENEIERLTISAPFSGVLETDTAELGSLLQPGALCATVLQLDPITLVGFVSELQVERVQMGAPAQARMASGRSVEGQVTFISRAADDTTRTFRVEIKVPNPELGLRDGETAEITIGAEGKNAHLLPQSALTLNDDGTLGLRIVDAEDKAKFVPVTLLRDTPSGVWLTGLPDEADVIIIGQEFVTDGVSVEPVYQELSQ
ncbi:efflux RND transporter periplasmic adaptor subunit, partial [uncultured Roseovarius sp.]|uniref:efflux RND transporter periplasmic adaptor subunit n=1 Tax=uncultured Roseovarius sp. TaxID=293344 RepID=UPI00262B7D50